MNINLQALYKLGQLKYGNVYYLDIEATLTSDTEVVINDLKWSLTDSNYANEMVLTSPNPVSITVPANTPTPVTFKFELKPQRYIKYNIPFEIRTGDTSTRSMLDFVASPTEALATDSGARLSNNLFLHGIKIGSRVSPVVNPWETSGKDKQSWFKTTGAVAVNTLKNPAGIVAVASRFYDMFIGHRKLGKFTVFVTFSEDTDDELVITEHPVEYGSNISDHAYRKPVVYNLSAGFRGAGIGNLIESAINMVQEIKENGIFGEKDSLLQKQYKTILKLMDKKETFKIVTRKRVYNNMLPRKIHVTTNKDTELVMNYTMTCQEIIMAKADVSMIAFDKVDVPDVKEAVNTGGKELTDAAGGPSYSAAADLFGATN